MAVGRNGELVLHPLHQPHAVLELLPAARAAEHCHHDAAVETAHKRVSALRVAARLASQASLAQQFVGVLEQADPAHQLAVLADLPRPDDVLPRRADLAEERYFEALGSQLGHVLRRCGIASQSVGVGEGAVGEAHFSGVPAHQRHKHCDIGLSALVGQVEAAEVPARLLPYDKAAQVVGDGQRDVVSRSDYQREQSLFQSKNSVLFWIHGQSGSPHPVVCLDCQQVEGGDTDEVLLDYFVGSVESEQL